jgi:3-oxoacid CoA-transferase
VFDIDREAGELILTELAPGISIDEVQAKTGAPFKISEGLKGMED